VDAVSVGTAAAVLLASKFGEGFAGDIGESAWNSVKRLREVVAAKFKHDAKVGSALARLDSESTEGNRSVVAELITAAVRADDSFGSEVARLVGLARRDAGMNGFVAQAFDSAKQVNFGGDNYGSINL
jgi:hypothetical protein